MNIILCQQTRHRIIAYYTYLLSQTLQKAAFLSEVLDFYTYVYKKIQKPVSHSTSHSYPRRYITTRY
jgi:hypothetical protein